LSGVSPLMPSFLPRSFLGLPFDTPNKLIGWLSKQRAGGSSRAVGFGEIDDRYADHRTSARAAAGSRSPCPRWKTRWKSRPGAVAQSQVNPAVVLISRMACEPCCCMIPKSSDRRNSATRREETFERIAFQAALTGHPDPVRRFMPAALRKGSAGSLDMGLEHRTCAAEAALRGLIIPGLLRRLWLLSRLARNEAERFCGLAIESARVASLRSVFQTGYSGRSLSANLYPPLRETRTTVLARRYAQDSSARLQPA